MFRRMMRVNFFLMLVAAVFLAACAQNESSSPTQAAATTSALDPAGPGPGRMMERLGLTDEQQAQVKTIFESHRTEREAIRQARRDGTSKDDLEAQHEALRAKIHEELKGVLTEAQMQQLEEWHKNRPRHMRGPMSDEDRAAMLNKRMEKLTTELGLSAEQQEKFRALWETQHAERPAPGQGQRLGREERQARHEAFLQEVKQILDADQFAKFQEMHPKGQGGRARRGRAEG